jgi:serine/threonine-protein kinase
VDFGIASNAGDSSGLTATNVTVGTVDYASPEQLMGVPIDGRADQYALAATAYHLLSGSPMFGSPNAAAVIGQHLNAPPPRLGDSRPALAALDPVLAKALSKNPTARFRTCTEFADALRQALGSGAIPPGPHAVSPPLVAGSAGGAISPSRRTAYLPRDYSAAAAADPSVGPAAEATEDVEPAPARWPWILAAFALVSILGALVYAVWPGDDGPRTAGPSTLTSSTSAATTSTRGTTTTSSTAPAAVSFDSMRDLVNGFYGQLPSNARRAWSLLDVHYQRRNGLDDYLGFWATIRSVSVLAIDPRDANSVVATIRYVLTDGRVDTEKRWLSVVAVNGELLIYDSERIGPA